MKLIEIQEGMQWIDAALIKHVRIHQDIVIIIHGDGARTEVKCPDAVAASIKAKAIVKQVNDADEALREMVRASVQAETVGKQQGGNKR